jgi:hypothetical protein
MKTMELKSKGLGTAQKVRGGVNPFLRGVGSALVCVGFAPC